MRAALELHRDADLTALNTFGVAARARLLAQAHTREALVEALDLAEREGLRVELLGGGSNVLIAGDLDAMVLLPQLRGVEWLSEDGQSLPVRAAAGENWHAFVVCTLAHGAFGLENLALIPGNVGAAPIQNIGAYGVELQRFIAAVEAWDRDVRAFVRLDPTECGFSYRDSRFKREPGRFVIVAVEFALRMAPMLELGYAGIREELASGGVGQPTPHDVFRAVCAIRRRKLPDPAVLGNAGSFFKNPVVPSAQALALKSIWPSMPSYPAASGMTKLAAGWLIEQCGWKGRRIGAAGVHAEHALVLVNHGGASGAELLALADTIRADVRAQFGVELEMEPRVLR